MGSWTHGSYCELRKENKKCWRNGKDKNELAKEEENWRKLNSKTISKRCNVYKTRYLVSIKTWEKI